MNKRKRYFRGVGEEARRVRWPNAKQLWKSVVVVLVIAIITAGRIALFDWAAMQESFRWNLSEGFFKYIYIR